MIGIVRRVRLRSHGNYRNHQNSDLKRPIPDRAREGRRENDSKSPNWWSIFLPVDFFDIHLLGLFRNPSRYLFGGLFRCLPGISWDVFHGVTQSSSINTPISNDFITKAQDGVNTLEVINDPEQNPAACSGIFMRETLRYSITFSHSGNTA